MRWVLMVGGTGLALKVALVVLLAFALRRGWLGSRDARIRKFASGIPVLRRYVPAAPDLRAT